MNSCTIRDVLRLALPVGTRLLTGELGLTRLVHRAASLRATLPAFPSLQGGELVLLSTEEALALDERLTLTSIITRLASVPIGAIAAAGAIDERAVEAALAADLPLLRLPAGTAPRDVERDIHYLFDNREWQIERRAAQLYSELTRQIAAAAGVEAVLRTVGEATGRAVAFYDAAGALRMKSGVEPAVSFEELRPREYAQAKLNGHPALVKGIGNASGAQPLGYVALGGAALDSWDDLAAAQAAAALLLEMAKQQAVQAVETRVGGELLHSIVSGTPADLLALRKRASELGYDLQQPHVALLLASADSSITAGTIRDRLQQELRQQHIAAPHVLREDAVLCLLPVGKDSDQPASVARVVAAALPIDAGLSTPAPNAAGWQRACAEAEEALALGRLLFGSRSLTFFRDLHVYRLLFELRFSPELRSFYDATLGALIEYDQRHQATLLPTLDVYFASHGNLSQASERLLIHRNTLLYRLRRIGQIAGVDMEHAEDMLSLQVALKAHRVLGAANELK